MLQNRNAESVAMRASILPCAVTEFFCSGSGRHERIVMEHGCGVAEDEIDGAEKNSEERKT
jgi:hypothetical protein